MMKRFFALTLSILLLTIVSCKTEVEGCYTLSYEIQGPIDSTDMMDSVRFYVFNETTNQLVNNETFYNVGSLNRRRHSVCQENLRYEISVFNEDSQPNIAILVYKDLEIIERQTQWENQLLSVNGSVEH